MHEEHETARFLLREVQGVEHGARDRNPYLLERLREQEPMVGGQHRSWKEQPLLRPIKYREHAGIESGSDRAQYQHRGETLTHKAWSKGARDAR